MCGICGIASFSSAEAINLKILQRMTAILYHRGPDDEGYYQADRIALGMRRLSIIDLQTGQQPIANEAGDVWVVYNGEIYNFNQLRAELESRGHTFRTRTDTEVIVHAFEEYGDHCVQQFTGMFALAIWDARANRLLLARDRVGIKPLYYWTSGSTLVFGSELKSLLEHPDVPRNIDPVALDLFLTLEYIPAPRTIYEGIHKLLPGHTLSFDGRKAVVSQYWDVPYNPITEDAEDCVEALVELIREAVRIRLVSDVPLGAFLSGGIDSSTVVGFMSQFSSQPVQTFSIGFEDDTYNELSYARAVARHFETDHHEEIIHPDIALMVESLARHQDEPFADTSIFPTYLVSKLARGTVKVVLSGDGGDELFAGYDTYVAERYYRYYGWLPGPIRQQVIPALSNLIPPQPAKKGTVNKIKRMLEGSALNPALQHTRWMIFLNQAEKQQLYQPEFRETLGEGYIDNLFESYFRRAGHFDKLAQQQYVDIKTYLADDILTKVDRMSMAVSLEARVPLLDHRIIEFALNLPASMKLNGTRTKIILRSAVRQLVPGLVLDKPKQGFSIPMKHWLRGTLKPMMMDLLSHDSLYHLGYFDSQVVATWIQEHLDGRVNHSHRLWPLMVFVLWHQSIR